MRVGFQGGNHINPVQRVQMIKMHQVIVNV
ncbi:Uncharacterised protein [Salmonella enterica subsp. enterica serovar Bovismorbificans]|uniref:Uncharacterized protein n=1 Tax=Salmonella enterica subsp. enterica serovar Bovismorbificans TaxID=58097 RepID=A0A655DCW0_SALET|nr:Uncharacterised protein [Salmonella enterica subsp. enterica serovar Bovismorbificans]